MRMITSYTALETAIQKITRNYYLARNLDLAAQSELPQCRQASQYQCSSLFHGELGKWRAHNILMTLHELPKDQESTQQYEHQLLLLLFAILPPHYTHNESGWLAELLREELIQGACKIKEIDRQVRKTNTLSSRVFSMPALRASIQHAMIDFSYDGTMCHRYEKSNGIRYMLRSYYLQMSDEDKSHFNADLKRLETRLLKQPKVDNSEMAVAIQMR